MSSSIWPSCAAHSGWRVRDGAQPPEPRDVVGVDHLDVREVVAAVVRAVGVARGLDGVERLAHGALRQRVEVHLEPERVQPRDGLLQQLRAPRTRSRGCRVGCPSASR